MKESEIKKYYKKKINELIKHNKFYFEKSSQKISDKDLSSRYRTQCDPRLNANQALELAFMISDEIKKNSIYARSAIRAVS